MGPGHGWCDRIRRWTRLVRARVRARASFRVRLGLALGFGGGRALVAEVLTTQGPHKRLVRGRGRGRVWGRVRGRVRVGHAVLRRDARAVLVGVAPG